MCVYLHMYMYMYMYMYLYMCVVSALLEKPSVFPCRYRAVMISSRCIQSILCVCVSGMQTIDSCQAMFLPIGASVSLLVMFLFFDSLQMVFAVCTASK